MRSLSAHPARVKNFFFASPPASRIQGGEGVTRSRTGRAGRAGPHAAGSQEGPVRETTKVSVLEGARPQSKKRLRRKGRGGRRAPAAQERERQTGNRRSCRGSWSGMRPSVSSGNSKSSFAAGASCRHSGLLVVPSLPQGSREPRRPGGLHRSATSSERPSRHPEDAPNARSRGLAVTSLIV